MRRIASISVVWTGALLLTAAVPALLPLTLAVDLLRRVSFATTRALAFLLLYLWAEAIGVVVAATIGADPEKNYALQRRWAAALANGAVAIYGLRVDVDGASALGGGPYLPLVRHAAVADVLLPMILVAIPRGLRPRYVLKQELLWDPCLDIVGTRIPNAFVRRDGVDTGAQLDQVRALARGLGPSDFVALYPEGTRFTPARRARALTRLDGADRVYAEGLRHTLPPRPGGVLTILDAAPDLDVVVVAHTGLEAGTTLADLMNGRLVHARWQIRCVRYPRASLPTDPSERVAWLRARWVEVDAWIAAAPVV